MLKGEHGIFNQLLGNGRTALKRTAGEVGEYRSEDALEVNAHMAAEAHVFDRNHCVLQVYGNILKLCPFPVFQAIIIPQDFVVYIIEYRGLVLLGNQGKVQLRHGLQIGFCHAQYKADAADAYD